VEYNDKSPTFFIFDFDGTLIDSDHVKRECFFTVISHIHRGKDIMRQILDESTGESRVEIFGRFVGLLGDQRMQDSVSLVKKYTVLTEDALEQVQEISGATAFLQAINRRDKDAFLVSATPVQTLKNILRARGMLHYFKGVFGVPGTKVDNVKGILSKGKWVPDEGVFFGNSIGDFEAATATGVPFVGVNYGSEQDVAPRDVITTFDEYTSRYPDLFG